MQNKFKRPKDTNQKAKMIVDIATGEAEETIAPVSGKNPAAVALGRLGGLKGGKARAKVLSAKNVLKLLKKQLKPDGIKKINHIFFFFSNFFFFCLLFIVLFNLSVPFLYSFNFSSPVSLNIFG